MARILLAFFIFMSMHTNTHAQQNDQHRMLRHVVMFGWKEGTDTAVINKVVTAFRGLPSQIPLIQSFEWGINNSPENLNRGLTHCFTFGFRSEADRDAYLIHPAHKVFVAQLVPVPEKITVFDYWAGQ